MTRAMLAEDDVEYLRNESNWLKRLSHRQIDDELKLLIPQRVKIFIDEIKTTPERLSFISEQLCARGAIATRLSDIPLNVDFNVRKEIEAAFLATLIREMILIEGKDTKDERDVFLNKMTTKYEEFLKDVVPTASSSSRLAEDTINAERTFLFRFERAIIIAKSMISGTRNKGLFLSVGNLLEGSDDYVRYITGGHSSKETKRRVLMIEHLCDIKPRKRTRKLLLTGHTSFQLQSTVGGPVVDNIDNSDVSLATFNLASLYIAPIDAINTNASESELIAPILVTDGLFSSTTRAKETKVKNPLDFLMKIEEGMRQPDPIKIKVIEDLWNFQHALDVDNTELTEVLYQKIKPYAAAIPDFFKRRRDCVDSCTRSLETYGEQQQKLIQENAVDNFEKLKEIKLYMDIYRQIISLDTKISAGILSQTLSEGLEENISSDEKSISMHP